MSKVLIVGGAGFVGSALAEELVKAGDEVVVFDWFQHPLSPLESGYESLLRLRMPRLASAKVVRGDARHQSRFSQTLRDEQPDTLVVLVALPLATESNVFTEHVVETNVDTLTHVFEAACQVPSIRHVVYTSSSMVYGDFQYDPADEDHPTKPVNVYGGTKLCAEILTRVLGRRFGIDTTILRPSAVYGPTDANRRVVQIFVERALSGKPLVLHDGGATRLDFTYVADLVQGIRLALRSPDARNETFNLTRGQARSLLELAEIVRGLVPGTQVVSKPRPKDGERPERGALSIAKARRVLGYDPSWSLEEGVAAYVDFVRRSGVIASNGKVRNSQAAG